jgi:uncharacterized protein (TIGR02118 family)
MIKVSFMYPNSAGSTFDMAYYLSTHIPLVLDRLGSAVKGVGVEECVAGSSEPYSAIGYLLFESTEAFETSFGRHADEIKADIRNYTNTTPTRQISELKDTPVLRA